MTRKPTTKARPTPRSAKRAAPKPAAKPPTSPAKPAKLKSRRAPRMPRAVQLERLLRRPDGVSTSEIAKAMGIQVHTARALISVNRRKFGWQVTLENRRYRIVDQR